jgi:hypothetical protein
VSRWQAVDKRRTCKTAALLSTRRSLLVRLAYSE